MSGPESTPSLSQRRPETQGILRLDCGKPRRSSGGSVDFRMPLMQVEPSSPQPSVDRLSVTFRDRSDCSDTSVTVNIFDPGSPPAVATEMVTFNEDAAGGDEDDDYSVSVTQILNRRDSTRRASQRRRKRRPSSPFSQQEDPVALRRRSSTYTESSADTAITMADDGPTQEQIFENIRLHKEVLSNVKLQPWSMRRKIKLVKQAKKYVKRHEGELQERLAQSKSTKDIVARFKIVMVKNIQFMKREMANMMTQLIPWELRIKEIESHFGSAVASYFTFLRWMFWVNLVISVLLACFVTAPEMIFADKLSAGDRKIMSDDEKPTSKYLVTLWDFEGILKYSPIFYGFYTNNDRNSGGYRLPFAYFMTGLAVYVYSFVATLRRMAENSRMSKLSEKDDECAFTWKLFSGWDFMIGNSETAHNRVASIVLGFKEALLEETEKKREEKNWKILGLRVLVNFLVLSLLTISAYIVFVVVERSTQPEAESTWWRQNEITVSLSIVSLIFPIFFELLGLLEGYHPRKCLRIQLARIMVLNLLNLYTLIFSLFWKISKMVAELQNLKPNTTTSLPILAATGLTTTTTPIFTVANITPNCYEILSNCATVATAATIITTTLLPLVSSSLESTTTTSTTYPTTSLESTTTTSTPDPTTSFESTTFGDNLAISTFEYDEIETSSEMFEFSSTGTTKPPVKKVPNLALYFYTLYTSLQKAPKTEQYLTLSTEISTEQSENSYSPTDQSENRPTPSSTDQSKNSFSSTDQSEEMYSSTDQSHLSTTPSISSPSTLCKRIECDVTPTSPEALSPITPARLELTTVAAAVNKTEAQRKRELSKLCWETMFGQELVKLTVMDLVLTVISTLIVDFFRAVLVRFLNHCWCWDLEKQFPQYGDFKIAENILHLVNNQGMVWMGMFFAPGLPVINLFKLMVMMYLRSWAVLTCNVPHEVVFRASRSNNFYLALLLTMLFLCVLPVGYAIVWIEPSWHCGPFSHYSRIYHIFTNYLHRVLPGSFQKALDYIASPAIVIPLLMLLILIIYYLVSLTTSLREANTDLKIQLRRERTEERRKMFQLVDKKNRKGSGDSDAFTKWKAILPEFSPKPEGSAEESAEAGVAKATHRREIISRLLKRAISSGTSDEENVSPEPTAPDKHADRRRSPMLEALKKVRASTVHEKPTEDQSAVSLPQSAVPQRRRSSTSVNNAQRGSIASDKIPVIKISKTESEECILSPSKEDTSAKDRFRSIVRKQIEISRAERNKKGEALRSLIKKRSEAGQGATEGEEALSRNCE